MTSFSGVIDAHAHCGVQDDCPPQAFDDYLSRVCGSDIGTVVMFPPVAEIYDRWDPAFTVTEAWRETRKSANAYLTGCGSPELAVIPYFFIWNDFAVDQISERHRGIKWHRHEDEPVYHYDDPRCAAAIELIRKRKLPVVLEESFENTVRFIGELASGVRVVIPHLGLLNGGYPAIREAGLWENPHVWADTALAGRGEITDYIDRYGHERLMYGSDFPFGDPLRELEKIRNLNLGERVERAVLGENLLRLLGLSG